MHNPRIEELARRDPRYAPEAYEFVFDALSHAARRVGSSAKGTRRRPDDEHVSVAEFLESAASWPCASSA